MFFDSIADHEMDQIMTPLVSAMSRYFRRSRLGRPNSHKQRTRSQGLCLETLENRLVPATSISIANATMNEIGSPSTFIAAGSGGLNAPRDMVLGPDSNLYVASSAGILRYNATTGQLIGTFVASGSGGLTGSYGVAFGPDGNCYVSSSGTDAVYRYSGTTGAFLNTFVLPSSGGLNSPDGILFGQDGNLYVTSHDSNAILRYQGPLAPAPGTPLPAAGQSGADFVPAASGGLNRPIDIATGPDGNLYVVSTSSNPAVLRYDGTTGGFLGTYVAPGAGSLGEPRGLAFDAEGKLYVSDLNTNAVHRYDSSGQFLDDPIAGSGTTLRGPLGMTFDAQGALLVSTKYDGILRYDSGVVVSLSSASPTPISVSYATVNGSATGTDYAAQAGTITFTPGQTSRRVLLATKDDVVIEGNENFSVQLSDATGGATIGSGSALVTIADDDGARQITITNASALEGDGTAHYRGAFIEAIPGRNFVGLAFDSGFLYAAPGYLYGPIDRYDATTGAFIDHFIPAGRIDGAREMVFRDGYMYVASEATDEVLRFNAQNGAFVDEFVPAGSGGLNGPYGMTFGPDVNGDGILELYVTGSESFNVLRYDGATGQPLGSFTTSGAGAVNNPYGLAVDPGGVVYVASSGTNQVQKYNVVTGAYLGAIANAAMVRPTDVKFGPDGLMYVLSAGNNRILRFAASGTYIDDYVPAGSGGISNLDFMTFGPDGDLYANALGSNNQIFRFGRENEALFTVSASIASSLPVTVNYATANGTAIAGSDYTATSGTLTFAPGSTSAMIRVPLLDDAAAESTEAFTFNLSNPTGATIANGTGVATIQDNDSTKFFVVDDASTDRTYRYRATGNSFGNTNLGTGDTAPRGAASTAAGTTVWVVDANRIVYVYSAAGALLGSWSSGLNSSAQVEGIATNGTDIWLLDNKQDKVFKYTGAASRLSGSQSAASSFSLNSSNSNGKGIVTDGTSMWVVDDGSSTDKVFKYTLTGSLLGSWTIDSGNSHPTGLTINPASVSDIWIVDNVTLKVYQYAAAASRTSGSQNAAATFALAAGNTNPQDIADPPAPDMAIPASDRQVPGLISLDVPFLRESLATPSSPTLSRSPALFAWLSQPTLAEETLLGGTGDLLAQAPGVTLAQELVPFLQTMKISSEADHLPELISSSQHGLVDQVFGDFALRSIDMELLGQGETLRL
jgi:sugar lactone lactonase YvrE